MKHIETIEQICNFKFYFVFLFNCSFAQWQNGTEKSASEPSTPPPVSKPAVLATPPPASKPSDLKSSPKSPKSSPKSSPKTTKSLEASSSTIQQIVTVTTAR